MLLRLLKKAFELQQKKMMFSIGDIAIEKNRLFLIAGPCVIESEEVVFKTAETLKEITQELKIPFIFKSSYDKANRSSINSYRGPGIKKRTRNS